MAASKQKSPSRWLLVFVHMAGWVTYLVLPLLFFGPGRPDRRMPDDRGLHLPPDNPAPVPGPLELTPLRFQSLFFNLLLVGFFYLNMYYLIPRLLSRRSWLHYVGAVIACFALILALNSVVEWLILSPPPHFRRPWFFSMVNFVLVFALSTALRLMSDRVHFERERKERETESLKSELSFLRSQVSPHFMFNVLNSLASLARKKSDKLESVIVRLSLLMRYMLYDSSEERVPVEKEVQYLQSYIELQQLRFGSEIRIDFNADYTDGELPIEPMLLIPFVENAFKHGAGLVVEPNIHINLIINDHSLHFTVRNKFNDKLKGATDPGSGIGIQNVQRRLQLLYRDMHHLDITREGGWFVVELKMILR